MYNTAGNQMNIIPSLVFYFSTSLLANASPPIHNRYNYCLMSSAFLLFYINVHVEWFIIDFVGNIELLHIDIAHYDG